MITEKDVDEIRFENPQNKKKIFAAIAIVAVACIAFVYLIYIPHANLTDARNRALLWSKTQASVNAELLKGQSSAIKQLNLNYNKIQAYCKNDIETITMLSDAIGNSSEYSSTCGIDCKITKSGDSIYIENKVSENFMWKSSYNLSSLSIEECVLENAEKFTMRSIREKMLPYASRDIIIKNYGKYMAFSGDSCQQFATIANAFQNAMLGFTEADYGYKETLAATEGDIFIDRNGLVKLSQYTILVQTGKAIEDEYKQRLDDFYREIIRKYEPARNISIQQKYELSLIASRAQLEMVSNCNIVPVNGPNEKLVDDNYKLFLSLYSQGKHWEALPYAMLVAGYEKAKGVL